MKRPTQVDVAKLAGVSRATVSLVINGLSNGKVVISEDTRNRVMQAVDELGYEPDLRAQALRSGDIKTIGMILIDMTNPHYWEHAEGVEQEARAQGYNVLLFTRSLDEDYIRRIFKDLSGRRIDGLVLAGGLMHLSEAAKKALIRIHKYRLPVVELSDRYPNYEIDCLVADYRLATVEAMTYLLSMGHRRISIIQGVTSQDLAIDRMEPYLDSLRNAGLPVDENLIANCGPTIEDGYQAAIKLLRLPSRPTAILAINDLLAIGVLRAASDSGLQVPTDLSIVGYDDIPLASYLSPRLTTATKNIHSIGQDAVRMVLERIQNPEKPYQVIYSPARLIIRESTGPAPALPADSGS
jgi:LacI family transcriptional regulator